MGYNTISTSSKAWGEWILTLIQASLIWGVQLQVLGDYKKDVQPDNQHREVMKGIVPDTQ